MVSKENRSPTINGNKYYVVVAQSKRRQRVSAYKHRNYGNYRPSKAIVTNREWKGSFLWYGKDRSSPIEQLIQETLNEAVCIREDKIEDQTDYEDRIDDAVSTVTEAHDS